MFNAIGAHIYAGGFTSGVSAHFNVLAHLEHSGYGADVVKLNFPDLPIHAGGPSTWPEKWPRGADRPRFGFANPPCAIWSGAAAGRAGRWQDDPRLEMHYDIVNYMTNDVAVDILAVESVPPSFTKGREHVDKLIECGYSSGYSTTIVMHNAKHLGVPQNRSRIFYVFHKIAVEWEHPEFGTPTTVRQALKGITYRPGKGYDPTLPPKIAALAPYAKPGEGLAKVFNHRFPDAARNERGNIKGRPSFLDGRAPWDRPANVVIAGKMIHPEANRFMSQEELAAICSFPKSYKWPPGDFNTISGYMSRGVMPKVGSWLAENVNRALVTNRRINRPTAAVLDVSRAPGAYYDL